MKAKAKGKGGTRKSPPRSAAQWSEFRERVRMRTSETNAVEHYVQTFASVFKLAPSQYLLRGKIVTL